MFSFGPTCSTSGTRSGTSRPDRRWVASKGGASRVAEHAAGGLVYGHGLGICRADSWPAWTWRVSNP
jgi:hypothetical protein